MVERVVEVLGVPLVRGLELENGRSDLRLQKFRKILGLSCTGRSIRACVTHFSVRVFPGFSEIASLQHA